MSVKEFFLIAFIKNKKPYKKSHLCLYCTFLIVLNTVRGPDKSYMINHVVYFSLKALQNNVSLAANFI